MKKDTRKIDTKELLKKPVQFDEETGEIYQPKRYGKKQATEQEAKAFPSMTTIALTNFRSQVRQFSSEKGSMILEKWLDRMIGDNGEKAVANMIRSGYEKGIMLNFEVIYKADARANYMYNMMNELEGQGEIYSDDVAEMMEEMESMEEWEII